tara:strand:- start:2216 stop:3052 length:837 start_codon:yes stop_codon:yes gene_type:complete
MKAIIMILLSTFVYSQTEYLVTIPATSYTEWVYYSFETHSIVEVEDAENSLDWDIGLQRKHFRSNSGLAGIGQGGGYVDSTMTWVDHWGTMNELPENMYWHTDQTFYDFYDINTHTYVEGIENPALRTWGWFNNYFQMVPTDYVMFVKCANGEDVVKLWAYDYYDGGSGNIAIRYQTGFTLGNLSNNINDNSQFMLGKAYPNPFNPSTTISLTLPNTEFVSVKVYNLMGQEIKILSEGILEASIHTFTWNANDVSSGVYLIKAESKSNIAIQKVLLVK